MKVTIFNGSPRKAGNTAHMVHGIMEEFHSRNVPVEDVRLFVKNILGCNNCNRCKTEDLSTICSIDDDMRLMFPKIKESEVIIFASPIYMWQLTPCLLAFINRMHCLTDSGHIRNDVKGKKIGLALTMGDDIDVAKYAIGGIKDFCEYYEMEYIGEVMIPFADSEKIVSGEYSDDISDFVSKLID